MSARGSARGITYEVSLRIDAAVADAYHEWLAAHVQEILALPGFIDARISEVIDPAAAAGEVALCVQYRLVDETALNGYLHEHAPRMRAQGVQRFAGRFRAERRVLRDL